MTQIAYVKIDGADQFRRLARELKDAGHGDLKRDLVRNIRREGQPALRAAQGRWRSVDVVVTDPAPGPGSGAKSTGLLGRIASATRIYVLVAGISIRVDHKKVDPRYGKTLVLGVDALAPWRHPTYGNTNVWVGQTGDEVFYQTLNRFESRWRRAALEAMEETARKIGG